MPHDGIRKFTDDDIDTIYEIINDAAIAYKGVIPDECWHEPYMGMKELKEQIADGVEFYCYEEKGTVFGVMGIQDRGEVCLIRHAYVRTRMRKGGIGTQLLKYLYSLTDKPVLIGTWRDASWAISFYIKNGFTLVDEPEKVRLLAAYWHVPEKQVINSVVLVDRRWMSHDVSG